ncbi:unnamed protein product [Brachionus calyciflorus]|uniref:Uncharacterized protein n=1 Tax=Brachionus calyciflorus TaxID=104777 RepID=A0A813Y3C6_9BILA|nr:unnamed protein product [Brachionus calyciflorus]
MMLKQNSNFIEQEIRNEQCKIVKDFIYPVRKFSNTQKTIGDKNLHIEKAALSNSGSNVSIELFQFENGEEANFTMDKSREKERN